jgi:hypothetical protein
LLYFHKYRLWKLWFYTSPETSLKHVFLVKQSYLNLEKSKFNATSYIGKKIDHTISCPIFMIRSEKLGTWQTIQVRSHERDKNNKFWEIYRNFLLAHWNFIKPVALQKRRIMILKT